MEVTLVIPGRNAAATLRRCLEAVVPLLDGGEVTEIVFVDDGSTDDSAAIAAEFPVRRVAIPPSGPGAARNAGWRAAATELVWFIDADCVAEPDALSLLRPLLDEEGVVGAGGSYGNMVPESLLACLIHEEIVARHRTMGRRVDFLATFNVLYLREALEAIGGFDEAMLKAQDADLAYRLRKAGGELGFDIRSRVGHYHPTRLWRYLRTQSAQGYWRVYLYFKHPEGMGGDAYSGWVDHLQPPLAMVCLASLPLLAWPALRWLVALPWAALALAQLPLTSRLVAATRDARLLAFAPMGFLRAFARGIGMTRAALQAPGWRARR